MTFTVTVAEQVLRIGPQTPPRTVPHRQNQFFLKKICCRAIPATEALMSRPPCLPDPPPSPPHMLVRPRFVVHQSSQGTRGWRLGAGETERRKCCEAADHSTCLACAQKLAASWSIHAGRRVLKSKPKKCWRSSNPARRPAAIEGQPTEGNRREFDGN